MTFRIQCIGITNVGLKRTNNEDAFVTRPDMGFCALADGMGGAAAGEIASRIFVDTAAEILGSSESSEETAERVKHAFTLANRRILDHVTEHPDHAGMGCTAEILAVLGEDVIIGHAGDSRTYRMRNHDLKQLTADHSLVQEQLDKGLLTPLEARSHPLRNVILRAVGTKEHMEFDLLKGKALAGDIFLLCTDGLTDMVGDEDIGHCMGRGGDLLSSADRLIQMALTAGGKDNVTVVLVKIE